jgi:putative hemolysin
MPAASSAGPRQLEYRRNMIPYLVLLVALLLFSAFFSGAETALFALSRHELHRFRQDKRPSRRLVADLMRHPRRLLLTLMIANVWVNMFIFALSLHLCRSLSGHRAALTAALGLIAPIVVTLFSEILPKGIAIVLRTHVAARVAPAVRIVQTLLTPIRAVLNVTLVEPITRLLVGGHHPDEYVTVDELRELVEMSERQRVIDADENTMLGQVIELGELHVSDILVPRVDIIAFDLRDDPRELRRILRERRLTKLPVYDGDIDRLAGLIYAKDLLLHPHRALAEMIRPIHYIPENISLTQLLKEFRRRRTQLAAVVDEHGGLVGLVTVEDVAMLIVGELAPEGGGEEERQWERIDERHYRVAGGISIREWSEQFHISRLDEEVTTLAGLILARLGRIPAVGDQVRMGNLLLTIESMRKHRIEWVLIELLDGTASPGPPASGQEVSR